MMDAATEPAPATDGSSIHAPGIASATTRISLGTCDSHYATSTSACITINNDPSAATRRFNTFFTYFSDNAHREHPFHQIGH
jgi:hypothetical protein